jgi:phosphoribosyl 1,2-cyclic phosphodiesterase
MSEAEKPVVHLSFWGTRGSISTPGRTTEKYGGNTPCVSVRHGNTHLIFDAGTGIRNLGLELAAEHARVGEPMTLHLFLSHTHWDHIQGLPFFAPAYMKGVKLIIYGSPSKAGALEHILRGQMKYDYFPVDMSELHAQLQIVEMEEHELTFGPFTIRWEEQIYHPGGCVRFKVTYDTRSLVYASDVELDQLFGKGELTPEKKRHRDQYMKFIKGADVLIGDGQYTAEEYLQRAGWGHTSIPVLCEVAHQAQVRQLAIFHHDPQHTDKTLDELWKDCNPRYLTAQPPLNVFFAREGITLPV